MHKLFGLTVLVAALGLLVPAEIAQAHGSGGKTGYRSFRVLGHFAPIGYYGHGRYYGHSYGRYRGYWGPPPGYYSRGGRVGALGRVDIDVRPKDAQVFVDGSHVGTAGQFDGWPDHLWLQQGVYEITLVHPEHRTVSREIAIYPRLRVELELEMEAGPSTPPPERPGDQPAAPDEIPKEEPAEQAGDGRRQLTPP